MIYLDYQATTPCDPRVVEKMLPYFTEYFGNPHSRNHQFGWDAEAAVEIARHQVAEILGANPKEIIFTSGATESNNLALKGVAYFNQAEKNHIITCVTEHKCILDTCRHLEQQGFEVTYLPVEDNGLLDLKKLEEAITEKTALVSIMAVNNEIGVIQPLQEIGALCRKKNVFFHTDAAQAVGKIPLNVKEMNIDLLSLSSHKLYGPKGIGALYVGRKPRVRLTSQMNGGGQERGMRSGTLSPALCVGLGEACRISHAEMISEQAHLTQLNHYFLEKIERSLDQVYLNGDRHQRVPGNLNLSFAHVEGEGLMMAIKDLAVSSGSACTSESLEPSYVLRALGVDEELAHTSLRIGFGRFTTLQEVDKASETIISAVQKLREMSPLWEMAQQGIDLKTINWAAH
ncbi:MAG: IscS subfamily cysteine desulfurase [Holosporales bacterium]|nr:IscS subfamily cysteine desulfurase [Holosporales bacterium]